VADNPVTEASYDLLTLPPDLSLTGSMGGVLPAKRARILVVWDKPPAGTCQTVPIQSTKLWNMVGDWADSDTRQMLQRVATDYEHMAGQLEKHLLAQ
jgi:hypothetical protein